MSESVPDNSHAPKPASPQAATKRVHTYSRLTTAIAVLALATAAYAVWRLDSARDRLDGAADLIGKLQTEQATLRAELKSQANRERAARRELDRRLDVLDGTPKQVQELSTALEELRGRAEGPERAWSRAEAYFLIELAQRRLSLDRDVQTAMTALQSADTRLAALRDPAVSDVRHRLASDIQALQSVQQPDVTGILARLNSAEEKAARAPMRGIVTIERAKQENPLPEGALARAWAIIGNAIKGLVSVRKIDENGRSVITLEEQALRRQHLQLLLFSARTAVVRHDSASYRSALASARQWMGEFFDLSDPKATALLDEIRTLELIDIDPALPDVSGAASALQKTVPAR